MIQYMYTVWLRDRLADKNEQDYEYPVCIIIEAENETLAKQWGDKLSSDFSNRYHENEILKSKIEDIDKYKNQELTSVPLIKYGYKATDEEIGW